MRKGNYRKKEGEEEGKMSLVSSSSNKWKWKRSKRSLYWHQHTQAAKINVK